MNWQIWFNFRQTVKIGTRRLVVGGPGGRREREREKIERDREADGKESMEIL